MYCFFFYGSIDYLVVFLIDRKEKNGFFIKNKYNIIDDKIKRISINLLSLIYNEREELI